MRALLLTILLNNVELIVSWKREKDENFKNNFPYCLNCDNHSYRVIAGSGRLLFLLDRPGRIVEPVGVYRGKHIWLCCAELMLQDTAKIRMPGSAAGPH
jgi:hypothetical protein